MVGDEHDEVGGFDLGRRALDPLDSGVGVVLGHVRIGGSDRCVEIEVARATNSLVIRGVVEHHQDVVNLIARRISPLAGVVAGPVTPMPSRDFR